MVVFVCVVIVGFIGFVYVVLNFVGVIGFVFDVFGLFKYVCVGVLDVVYVELGLVDGLVVIFFYGWLYDIYSYECVVFMFVVKGYCVLVFYVCGYGDMWFFFVRIVCNVEFVVLV